MRVLITTVFLLVFACGSFADAVVQSGLGRGPATSSAAPVSLNAVDSIIQQAIADHNIPGAVLVVGHDGKIIYRKA
jgi:CubicO group peptidase (beta-lactamase class C family)